MAGIVCPRGVVACVLLIGASAAALAQPHSAHGIPAVPDDLLARVVPLRADVGKAHDRVSTRSGEAQAFYDQGLAYLHGYVWIEAARSINTALAHDPLLACYPRWPQPSRAAVSREP